MRITLIFAASDNDVIGKNGTIPWDVPADGKYFNDMTTGHPVIMGRKTYEFIGKPLANRHNIILTSDPNYPAPGCSVARNVDQALAAAKADNSNIFIIGGASIYKLFESIADTAYQTHIHITIDNGDTTFKLDPSLWQLTQQEPHPADTQNKLAYTFLTYKKRSS